MKVLKLPRDKWEIRPCFTYGYIPCANGRSMKMVDCPFCGEKRIPVYVLSFHGGGKRCPSCHAHLGKCGAIKDCEVSK